MGIYNSFVDRCPDCEAQTDIQTKAVIVPTMAIIKVGSWAGVEEKLYGARLELKGTCDCGHRPIASISPDGRFAGFTTNAPTHRELWWGVIIPATQARDVAEREQEKHLEKAVRQMAVKRAGKR